MLNAVSTSAMTGMESKYDVDARPMPINNGPITSSEK